MALRVSGVRVRPQKEGMVSPGWNKTFGVHETDAAARDSSAELPGGWSHTLVPQDLSS